MRRRPTSSTKDDRRFVCKLLDPVEFLSLFLNQLAIQENVPLAPLTTLDVGGPARYFTRAGSEESVRSAVQFVRERGIGLLVLGGGSNVVVSDHGFDGLVVKVAIDGLSEVGRQDGTVALEVGAGMEWDRFVEHCANEGLAGVECLSGIPGLVGGTPIQNVGAYGQDVSETIASVRCLDLSTEEIVEFDNAACGFRYRASIFNTSHRGRYVVLSATFVLKVGGAPKIAYRDLQEYFDGREPGLSAVREAVLKIRRAKSMVIDPLDPNAKSAGSFFKNPVVDADKLAELRTFDDRVPYFDFDAGFKVPAAWLIENSGFQKGFVFGRTGISTRHSLAIINRGGASASEIIVLSNMIREAVAAKFGVDLVPEPIFVGF